MGGVPAPADPHDFRLLGEWRKLDERIFCERKEITEISDGLESSKDSPYRHRPLYGGFPDLFFGKETF